MDARQMLEWEDLMFDYDDFGGDMENVPKTLAKLRKAVKELGERFGPVTLDDLLEWQEFDNSCRIAKKSTGRDS